MYEKYKDNCLGVISDVRFPIHNVAANEPYAVGDRRSEDKDRRPALSF